MTLLMNAMKATLLEVNDKYSDVTVNQNSCSAANTDIMVPITNDIDHIEKNNSEIQSFTKRMYLWMLKSGILVESNKKLDKNISENTPVSKNTFCAVTTKELLDYATFLEIGRKYLVAGSIPPREVLIRLCELIQLERFPGLLEENHSLISLLRNAAHADTDKEKDEAIANLKRRKYLLQKLVNGKHEDENVLSKKMPDDIRERARFELRILRLRDFQTTLQNKLLSETNYISSSSSSCNISLAMLNNDLLHKLSNNKNEVIEKKKISSVQKSMIKNEGVSLICKTVTKKLKDTPSLKRMSRIKLDRILKDLPAHCKKLQREWSNMHETILCIAKEAFKRVETILIKKESIREKERRERLKLLKENDFEKYLELIKQSKNARIEELLTQTDKFLSSISTKVKAQQEETLKACEKKILFNEDNIESFDKEEKEEKEKEELVMSSLEVSNETNDFLKSSIRQPNLLTGGNLLPYQLTGLQFLVNLYNSNLSGILADEMGLGKTIQTIALLAYLKENKNNKGPHIIIVPLSTLPNWITEFEKWCPSLNILEYRGNRDERKNISRTIKSGNFNVCVTTYEWILRDKNILSYPYWSLIIVDEGHRLKNHRSKFHSTLADFKSTHRLLLTGTPLQNNLTELWALLNFLLPHIFSSSTDFELWFEEPFKNFPSQQESVDLTDEEKFLIINRLHTVLRPFLLRRIKEDVLKDLPVKREYTIRVQLSAWQKIAYQTLSDKVLRMQQKTNTFRSFANVMMQLRKIVNHPYLFEDEYFINDDLFRVSGKFEVLDRMLPKLIEFKHKTLIFCQMTLLMDILDDYLDYRGFSHCRLDGTTLHEERKERTTCFNNPESEILIFTLSTRSGGLGINLQAADTVIIFDSDWNPHQDQQAQARAHRMGQKNEVRVFKLVTVSGIEEAVLSKAQHKLNIDEKIIQAGMFNNKCSEEERQTKLRKLLYSKSENLDARVTTPQELNRFMARTEEEEIFFQSYDENIFGKKLFKAFEELCPQINKKYNNQTEDISSLESLPINKTISEYKMTTRSLRAEARFKKNNNDKIEEIQNKDSIYIKTNINNKFKKKNNRNIQKKNLENNELISTITEEELLINSSRLMSYEEIPETWLRSNEVVELPKSPINLKRTDRRGRCSLPNITTESLSEAAFARALKRLETGEAKDLESAVALEKNRKRGTDNKRQRSSDSSSSSSSEDIKKVKEENYENKDNSENDNDEEEEEKKEEKYKKYDKQKNNVSSNIIKKKNKKPKELQKKKRRKTLATNVVSSDSSENDFESKINCK